MMAAAVVGRDLCYFTFNDVLLTNMIHSMHQFIKDANYTVGKIFIHVCTFGYYITKNLIE